MRGIAAPKNVAGFLKAAVRINELRPNDADVGIDRGKWIVRDRNVLLR